MYQLAHQVGNLSRKVVDVSDTKMVLKIFSQCGKEISVPVKRTKQMEVLKIWLKHNDIYDGKIHNYED